MCEKASCFSSGGLMTLNAAVNKPSLPLPPSDLKTRGQSNLTKSASRGAFPG